MLKTLFFQCAAIIISPLGLFLIFIAFPLWALINCLGRQFSDKLVWVLVILFLPVIGSTLYCFMVVQKEKKETPYQDSSL